MFSLGIEVSGGIDVSVILCLVWASRRDLDLAYSIYLATNYPGFTGNIPRKHHSSRYPGKKRFFTLKPSTSIDYRLCIA